jgi:hypothetical protein
MQCVTQGALAQRLHDLHPCQSLLFTIRAIPFPRLHLLSEPCPVVKMPFLASFSFRAQASGAFYKSISGSYPELTSAYCDSVRDQCSATTRYLRFSRLSLLSLVSSVPGETRPTIPKCLLSARPFLRVEFKARAEYGGI